MGNKIITPADVNAYCECFKVDLTIEEREIIFLMKEWAGEAVAELKDGNEE